MKTLLICFVMLLSINQYPIVGYSTENNYTIFYYDTNNDGIGDLKAYIKIKNGKPIIIKTEKCTLKPAVRKEK